ncbi:MAG TPA: acyl-CoA dehydrogenase family protein [Candidatus Paceibacterota bacterium]|nr:acyl-CoA dehydrogenase family protein [Verrucomicrobiota bacterium]HRY48278.1 acyl-CoA dehydrogenase family protein [Candidatus Paceibacterota bacterium]HRZ99725.1 acyl-CoA dehydrogenase family protein [Candidatus Paceibacterota bacterium]
MTQEHSPSDTLRTLPGDDARQILWRYSERFDLQMLIQSARSVARGPVARLVAEGARNTHEWTDKKAQLLPVFDAAGITSAFMDPEHGGYIEGPKNLALALVAFELSWVDAGAATGSLAGNLALAPIHERGTPEQKQTYLSRACPPKEGEDRRIWRGAFALTEPLPYVGVETGLLGGKMTVAEWEEGKEPILQVEKRGRFITNMGFANFVTAAVDSGDARIKGSCIIILEETDPGNFFRGIPTRKLVHQLSSTRDPVFSLRVPASRIVGGYTIKNGMIVPNYSHGEVIEAVFRRTRVTVGLMTSAKLLSAVEPIIRYQRGRFRGGDAGQPGSPRYELGLQQKEDALHRLVDIWATGEASASLGFATARIFDQLDPLERHKDNYFQEQKIEGTRAQLKFLGRANKDAMELLELTDQPEDKRDPARFETLRNDPFVQFVMLDSVANVLCPATKLWNTGYGANMMREAVSLMGGYGITEDCPGFLGYKWMDAQLEATYEGPEAVQRRQLSVTMTQDLFLAQYRRWIREMRRLARSNPGTGACTLASAMEVWLWTLEHLQKATDALGERLYLGTRQGVTFPLADALCWLLAARCQILDFLELEEKGPQHPSLAEGLPGLLQFLSDLCHVQAGRAAGEVGRICAELIFGYNRHPAWDAKACNACYDSEDLDALEGVIPGIASAARGMGDTFSLKTQKTANAGPCVAFDGLDHFVRLRLKLDGCLTGARLTKDRAAEALTKVMIPEALDYPA